MKAKMQIPRALLRKLPEQGYLYRFYRVLKISRATIHDWINYENMPTNRTRDGCNIIIKSEFIEWLEREGRIKE